MHMVQGHKLHGIIFDSIQFSSLLFIQHLMTTTVASGHLSPSCCVSVKAGMLLSWKTVNGLRDVDGKALQVNTVKCCIQKVKLKIYYSKNIYYENLNLKLYMEIMDAFSVEFKLQVE